MSANTNQQDLLLQAEKCLTYKYDALSKDEFEAMLNTIKQLAQNNAELIKSAAGQVWYY